MYVYVRATRNERKGRAIIYTLADARTRVVKEQRLPPLLGRGRLLLAAQTAVEEEERLQRGGLPLCGCVCVCVCVRVWWSVGRSIDREREASKQARELGRGKKACTCVGEDWGWI